MVWLCLLMPFALTLSGYKVLILNTFKAHRWFQREEVWEACLLPAGPGGLLPVGTEPFWPAPRCTPGSTTRSFTQAMCGFITCPRQAHCVKCALIPKEETLCAFSQCCFSPQGVSAIKCLKMGGLLVGSGAGLLVFCKSPTYKPIK